MRANFSASVRRQSGQAGIGWMPCSHGASSPARNASSGVRQHAQQLVTRASAPLRPSAPLRASAPPPIPSDAPRRSVEVATQVTIGEPRVHVPRAFGAAAIHDEATLEVPAYLRRSRP